MLIQHAQTQGMRVSRVMRSLYYYYNDKNKQTKLKTGLLYSCPCVNVSAAPFPAVQTSNMFFFFWKLEILDILPPPVLYYIETYCCFLVLLFGCCCPFTMLLTGVMGVST